MKNGATVILVTHNMEEIAREADRMIVLGRQDIPEPEEIFARAEQLESMRLEVPDHKDVFGAAPLGVVYPGPCILSGRQKSDPE